MGLFKSIGKGLKNITKGIGKVGAGVFKGIKTFAKSKIGKLVILAAAVYFTAGLAAYAGIGATAATGVAGTASAFSASSVGATLGLSSVATVGTGAAAGGASAGAAAGVTAETIAATSTALPTSGFLASTAAAAPTVGAVSGGAAASGGLLSTVGGAIASNPALALGATAAIGKGIEAAATPSAASQARKQLQNIQNANSLGQLYVGDRNVTNAQVPTGVQSQQQDTGGLLTQAQRIQQGLAIDPNAQPAGPVIPQNAMPMPGMLNMASQFQQQQQINQAKLANGQSAFI